MKYNLDLETSRQIADKINAQPKACWYNASLAMKLLPWWAYYVEGFVGGNFFMEHGWCEVDGKVIDPTFWNSELQPVQYFPAYRYTKGQFYRNLKKTRRELPFVWKYGKVGSFEYQWAMQQALLAKRDKPS